MKLQIATLALAALAGCASGPSPQDLIMADWGAWPKDPEATARTYLDRTLKDPSSVQVRDVTKPKSAWVGSRFDQTRYGYLVCVTYNAKNSYGGYVGFRTDGLLIHNEQVVEVFENGRWGTNQMC